jgi:hypothetical protein
MLASVSPSTAPATAAVCVGASGAARATRTPVTAYSAHEPTVAHAYDILVARAAREASVSNATTAAAPSNVIVVTVILYRPKVRVAA